ncbi:MAG: histidine kinase [Burkholderiaceae bacterium]
MKPQPRAAPELPHLVMRRALVVAVLAWLLVLALGLVRAGDDIDREVSAALHLSALGADLSRLATMDDARAIDELKRLERAGPLRHLSLSVRDAQGLPLLEARAPSSAAWPVSWLVALHRSVQGAAQPPRVSWPLARAQGGPWQITLAASRDSERVEAMENLAGALVVVALGAAALLAAMAFNVRRAFRPMRPLLAAIERLRGGDAAALRALPAMPTRELQSITDALRALGDALADAEAQRRALSHKLMTLQEDERTRLARELHDEFGQRLTSLRADAAWLRRRVAADAEAARVVDGVARQAEVLQSDVRDLLARLQPAGTQRDGMSGAQLVDLLVALVKGWNASPGVGGRFELDLGSGVESLELPRALALTIYRISQEALTNAARHAHARSVVLALALDDAALAWRVEDDGQGIDDWPSAARRGSGLAGLRERVWAMGADLRASALRAGARPGLVLSARFELRAAASPARRPLAAAA